VQTTVFVLWLMDKPLYFSSRTPFCQLWAAKMRTSACSIYTSAGEAFFHIHADVTNTHTQGRIYARAKGARAQGGILKTIEIEVWYVGKKGCPRERNLREIYTENTMFCLLPVFCVVFAYTKLNTNKWRGGGRQNFLGPRGVKYLNTGLLTPLSCFPFSSPLSHCHVPSHTNCALPTD
jgi:hypothetical protein